MNKLLLLLCCVYLSGCVTPTSVMPPELRIKQSELIAKKRGWQKQSIHTSIFNLKAYGSPASKTADVLTIYLEGDGLAWLAEDTPSTNPTPVIATALQMAVADQKNNPIAYLARPCQFVLKKDWIGCKPAYWTHGRFAPEVIHTMNQAVSQLKKQYHAQHLILIGYSGGGTIATLITARRKDVIQLITVAAILDTEFWVRQERLTPLYGSLNPAAAWRNLITVPQTHWVGGKDAVVPKAVAFAFAQRFPATQRPEIRVIPSFDHACCWAKNWSPFKALKSGTSSSS